MGSAAGAGNAELESKLAAGEYAGRVKQGHVAFSSPCGSGQVPLLVEIGGRERGIYVETGTWDWPAIDRCHRWLAVLRASERRDLDVDVRSVEPVPEAVSFYLQKSPRVLFELAGLAACRWVGVAGFAAQNAAALRRLAREHLGLGMARCSASRPDLGRHAGCGRPGGVTSRAMAYRIVVTAEAAEHIAELTAGERGRVLSALPEQLVHQPTVEARNRKRMRPNTLAQYRLRVGGLRVYYDVDELGQTVRIKAVGVKIRNRVYVGGEEIDL